MSSVNVPPVPKEERIARANPAQKDPLAKSVDRPVRSTPRERIFARSHGVTPAQLAELTKRFPDWEFRFGHGALHPHPIGATERAICEQIVYEDITRVYGRDVQITDIGGNANRHSVAGRDNVHSCNPVLGPADAVRRRPDYYKPDALYCTQQAQSCPITPEVYLAVHSLYYLTPLDVLEFVHRAERKTLYAVNHAFGSLYGAMHGVDGVYESTYQTHCEGDDLWVHMKVHGNHTGYTHSASTWLLETNYYSDGVKAMAWTSTPIGDSFTYVFTDAPLGLRSESTMSMSLCESISRSDHYGKINGVLCYGDQAEFAPTLTKLRLKTGRSVSFGPFAAMYVTSRRTVLVPKDIVAHVGNMMVGLERNEKTLARCIFLMRGVLRKFNVPEEMKLTCLTYGASMAFVYSLQDEIYAFNDLCRSPMTRMFSALSRALSLTPLGCCGISSMRDAEPRRVETALSARQSYAETFTTPITVEAFDAKIAWPKGLPGTETSLPHRPIKKGATIRATGAEEEKEYGPQLQANCITFTPIQAVVPNPSKNNEEGALRNRALVETGSEDSDLWEKVHAHARTLIRTIEPIKEKYDDMFMKWNAKFPQAQQQKHEDAYLKILQDGLDPTVDLKMKMFIKREVTLKTGEQLEDYDARAIQGCTDEMKVSYGPFIWAAGKKLCQEWDLDNRITYTSGLTAEQVGAWRDQFGDDEVTIVELDESRYDAHQGAGVHNCSRILKNACGMNSYPLPTLVEENIYKKKGRSRFFVYSVPGTMTSGKDDTSMSNSYVNGVKLDYFLISIGIESGNFRMLVNGDDSLVVIRQALSEEKMEILRKYLVEENRKLGFATKCKIRSNWHEVEYCSGLFWPVEGGYVLGPKIGKRLPKLGFGTRQLVNAEVVSLVKGMEKDLLHLPVLGVYVKVCQKYSSKLHIRVKDKNRTYVDKEARYKSICSKAHKRSSQTDDFFFARYGISANLCEKSLSDALARTRTITDCVHYPMMFAFARDL